MIEFLLPDYDTSVTKIRQETSRVSAVKVRINQLYCGQIQELFVLVLMHIQSFGQRATQKYHPDIAL